MLIVNYKFKKMSKYTLPLHVQKISEDGIHIFINIRINGKLTRALIDTGASETVLDIKSIKGEAELIKNQSKALGVNASELEIFKIKINSLSLSKLKIENTNFTVMDLNNINASYIEMGYKPFYAIIGGDILLRHKAIIDYNAKKLIINK